MKRSLSIFMSAVLIITVCSVFFAGITASAVPYGKDQVSGNNYQMNLGSLAYLEGHIYVGGADQIASTKNYSHTHLFHVYDYDGAEYMDPASDPLKNVASDYYDANGFHCFEQTFQDDNSAYAIYNFDRYNSTAADLSQINATINTNYKSFGTSAFHAFGIGSSSQKMMAGSTVWVRTYIIDKNGETEYGDIKSYTINANSNAADDEIIMLDSQSYDLTAENEGNDAPAQVDEPTEESNDIIAVILDMLKTIAARIVNYIKLALAIIK